jgi:hypothetical protein
VKVSTELSKPPQGNLGVLGGRGFGSQSDCLFQVHDGIVLVLQLAVHHAQVILHGGIVCAGLEALFEQIARERIGALLVIRPRQRIGSTGRVWQGAAGHLGERERDIEVLVVFEHCIGQVVRGQGLARFDLQRLPVVRLRLGGIAPGLFERAQERQCTGIIRMRLGPLFPGADRAGDLPALNLNLYEE